MKKIDFEFYDKNEAKARLTILSNISREALDKRKTEILLEAIEKREGRSPREGEVARRGRNERQPNGEEFIYWGGLPLLWYGPEVKDDKTGRISMKYKIIEDIKR